MFRGINAISVDTKGRLVIPTRYRDVLLQMGAGHAFHAVMTIDTESPCLLLYPAKEWETIESKLQALSSFNPASRRVQRLLLGHATELELDSAGRILVPPLLREYAGLDKKTVLIGQGKKFEIWDETKWNENREVWLAKGMRQADEIPQEILDLSL